MSENDNLVAGVKELVKVDISTKDGMYIATSKDLLGLFVAERNIMDFVSEIPEIIKAIYKEQFDEQVTVEEITEKKEDDCIRTINFAMY